VGSPIREQAAGHPGDGGKYRNRRVDLKESTKSVKQ
jgi:hypothetical protein